MRSYMMVFTLLLNLSVLTDNVVAAELRSGYAADIPRVADLRDLGSAPGSTPIAISLTLNYQHERELRSLIASQADARSPFYHKYLSNAQFDAFFAPSTADHAHVVTSLLRAGFVITRTYRNRTLVDATAPAAVVNRYFSTDLHFVEQAGAGIHYANARPALMPRDLRGILGTVELNNLEIVEPLYRQSSSIQQATAQNRARSSAQTSASQVFQPGQASRQAIGGPLYGPDGGYGPLAAAQGYDLPVQHGYDGSSRTAGIVIWADYLDADIAAYEKQWGIQRTGSTKRVKLHGGGKFYPDPKMAGNPSIEAELDVETIEGLSPGANIVVYEFPKPSVVQIEDAYNTAVVDNVVDVLNSSFGGCESSDTSFATATNQYAMQGAAIGMTFAAAAGDYGSNECGRKHTIQGVETPAGGPEFISIGGTSLQVSSNGAWGSEEVWNSNGGAGGGGVSTVFNLPSYQQGIPNMIASGRNQPDIALSADPSYGTSLYFNGQWIGPEGGTSWASPIFTAYVTQVGQVSGARTSFMDPQIYGIFSNTNYSYFHDITSGNNFGYNAGSGYDQASGIGSLLSGYALASSLVRPPPTIAHFLAASNPCGIAAGPDGNIWFIENGFYSYAEVYTTSGSFVAQYGLPQFACMITSGPDGNLWFLAAQSVGSISTSGAGSVYPLPQQHYYEDAITAGPDGNIWFVEDVPNKIGRITPLGALTEYVIPTQGALPAGIASSKDGALWFTESGAGKVGRITTQGSIKEYGVPTVGSGPIFITSGPDGNLWFTESSAIGRITRHGKVKMFSTGQIGASGIATGPDGNLWFTANGLIGRITVGGAITTYPIPPNSGYADLITGGSDGNLFFTERNQQRFIGKVTL
jgi:subtilase family serine protease